MFWDGTRWIDEHAPETPAPPRRRRSRDWLATGVMIVGIAALAVPFVATSAAPNSADRLVASRSDSYGRPVFQGSTRNPQANPNPGQPAAKSATLTPTRTLASIATLTPTPTPASIATLTPTPTPASIATLTPTPTPASIATLTPTPTPASIATLTPTPTPASIATLTPTPTPASIATPTPTPTPASIATPTPTPTPASTTVRVTSIPALLSALANNAVTEIVVANGTYSVSPAGNKAATSLWIGAEYAARTQPILVRAETTGGVTFDGGGTTYFGGISFQEGAHDQTWQGFTFAHGEATSTGVIMFGGYAGSPGAHHITLRDITIAGSCTSSQPAGVYHDHAVYVSYSVGGVHDVLIDGLTVDGAGGLDSAIQFYHSDPANRNAWNFTVRNMHVSGTKIALIVWDSTISNIVVEDSTITNAVTFAVRYEDGGTLTLRRVVSTGSGAQGFYSSLGANPPGVMFDNVSLR